MISSSAMRRLASLASRSSSRLAPTTLARPSAVGLSSPFFGHNNTVETRKNAAILHQKQSFSSMGMVPRRGFPQYTVFGENAAISIRAQMPTYKKAGADGVSVDRRGKLVLDFVRRQGNGSGFAWDTKSSFSLTAEEIGLCVSQLPGAGVELSHKLYYGDGEDGVAVKQLSGDMIEKVLTIEPMEGAALSFKLDYVKGGVGGQTPEGTSPGTPFEVTLQAGEFEVVKSVFQTSIPYLLGWNACMDLAAAAAISKGVSGGGNQFY